jgi:hypothetical protein
MPGAVVAITVKFVRRHEVKLLLRHSCFINIHICSSVSAYFFFFAFLAVGLTVRRFASVAPVFDKMRRVCFSI